MLICKFIVKNIYNIAVLVNAIVISILFVLLTNTIQNASAHQKQLVSIGGKDYLFDAGNANEPIFVDDRSGVELFAYIPNATDPLSTDSNSTKPIQDLEKTLKVEVSAGDKKKVLNFEPIDKDPGHYIASFFPTVQTTYNYRIFGNISGIPVSLIWTCSPGSVNEDSIVSNSTVKISNDVERKAVVGGFSCPEQRSDASFPEPYTSNIEMNDKISTLEKEISQLQPNITNSTNLTKSNTK